MYNSKYYTCEQIDQRLLQGYYDDAVAAGYTGSKAQYLAGLLKAINHSANPTITADKVLYNPTSGLTSKNVKAAIDELANKKVDKAAIVQESGEAEDKVMSQKAVSDKFSDLVTSLKDNFSYKGIAQPTTNPGVPDSNVFYIAGEGTYTNFSNQVVEIGQIAVLKWDGSWHKEVLEIGADGGNMILDWNTDVATTRKQVLSKYRKPLLQISYKVPEGNIINEQYIGTYTMDSEWAKDSNWEQVPNQNQIADTQENILINSDIKHSFIKERYINDIGSIDIGTSFNIKLYDISTITGALDIYAYISNGNFIQYAFYDGEGTSASNLIGSIDYYPKGVVDTVYKNVTIPEGAKQLALVFDRTGTPKNRGFCINSSKAFIKDFSEEDETSSNYIKNIPDKIRSKVADSLMQDANACNYYVTHLVKDKNYTSDIPVELGDIIYVRTDGYGTYYRLQTLGADKKVIKSIQNATGKGGVIFCYKYVIDDENVKFIKSYIDTGSVGSKYGCFLYIKRTANTEALNVIEKIEYGLNTSFIHSILTYKDINTWYLQYVNKEMNSELDFSTLKYVGFISPKNFIGFEKLADNVKFSIRIKLKLINSADGESVILSPYLGQSDVITTTFNIGDTKELIFNVNYNSGTAHIQVNKNCKFEVVKFDVFLSNKNVTKAQITKAFEEQESLSANIEYDLPIMAQMALRANNISAPEIGDYTAFGDSYTAGWSISDLSYSYVNRVGRFFGLNVNNLGVGGSKPLASSNLSDENLAKITDKTILVTIAGGTNGWVTSENINETDRETSVGAFNYAIDYIETNFPRAYIVLITPPRTMSTRGSVIQAAKDIIKIGANRNLPVADVYNKIIPNERTASTIIAPDELHYSDIGNEKFAGVVIGTILSVMY